MTESHISIKSSDFIVHAFKSFNDIQGDNLYTDVTLVSEDNIQIRAHKLILSAGSEYFRDILSDKAHPHPMLCLDGVTYENLDRVLKYLYVGEVSIPHVSLQEFLQVSQKFKCYGLNKKEPILDGKKDQPDLNQQNIPEHFEQTEEIEILNNSNNEWIHDVDDVDYMDEDDIDNMDEWNDITKNLEEIEKMKKILVPENSDMVPKFNGQAPEFCRIEGKTFSNDQLKQILENLYFCSEDGFYSCKHCDYEPTKQKWHILEHTQKHLDNFEVDCDRCGKTFESFDTLRAHTKNNCLTEANKISVTGQNDHHQITEDSLKNESNLGQKKINWKGFATPMQKINYKWTRNYNLKDVCGQISAVMDEVKIPWDKLSFTKEILDPMIADKRVTYLNLPPGRAGRKTLRDKADKLKKSISRIVTHFEETSELPLNLCNEEVAYLIRCIIQDSKKYARNVRQVPFNQFN